MVCCFGSLFLLDTCCFGGFVSLLRFSVLVGFGRFVGCILLLLVYVGWCFVCGCWWLIMVFGFGGLCVLVCWVFSYFWCALVVLGFVYLCALVVLISLGFAVLTVFCALIFVFGGLLGCLQASFVACCFGRCRDAAFCLFCASCVCLCYWWFCCLCFGYCAYLVVFGVLGVWWVWWFFGCLEVFLEFAVLDDSAFRLWVW